jgi:hypothetical protein
MFLGERVGSASALDSSLLTFGFTAELGFLHGAALCEAEGIPLDSYSEAANALMPILAADMLKATRMISKSNYAGEEASLEISASAFGNIVRFSDDAGVNRAASELLVSLVKRAIDSGYAGDEFQAVFEVLRKKKKAQDWWAARPASVLRRNLRLVHRRLRHRRLEGRQGAAQGVEQFAMIAFRFGSSLSIGSV